MKNMKGMISDVPIEVPSKSIDIMIKIGIPTAIIDPIVIN